MKTRTDRAMVVGPADGTVLNHPSGAVITIKARAEATGGEFSLLETVLPPGGRVPPHIHHHENESTYVLEGELSIEVGDTPIQVSAGSFFVVPRDTHQSFTNAGPGPCRFLTFFTPGGNERFFEESAQLGREHHGSPPPEAVKALHERYGMQYL